MSAAAVDGREHEVGAAGRSSSIAGSTVEIARRVRLERDDRALVGLEPSRAASKPARNAAPGPWFSVEPHELDGQRPV